ncbi:MAG: protein adenylyltransferase SelO family protein, partial [Acidimicrobiia bacterium]|nr:protein adenylyltransferase SelO family protein [Acidimicrobiia bacterium]
GADEPTPATYAAWFDEVCRLSSDLVVEWMRVGFVHGVMNTDNMSIHGLTIDYGPYGWLDDFDQNWTPNTTDAAGRRYRFGYQPQITQWNLLQLANAIVPLTEETEPLEASLNGFAARFRDDYRAMMLAKLGLEVGDSAADDALIGALLDLLQATEIDMTIFYRRLAAMPLAAGADREPVSDGDELVAEALAPEHLGGAYYSLDDVPSDQRAKLDHWLRSYRRRVQAIGLADPARAEAMNRLNPKYVLRNYLAQLAIDAAETGDFSLVQELAEVLRRPYDEQPAAEAHAARRPDWARNRPGCSMLSCSS